LGLKSSPEITPAGTSGSDSSACVFASITCSLLMPSSFVANAIRAPSSESANSSTFYGIFFVRSTTFFVAKS